MKAEDFFDRFVSALDILRTEYELDTRHDGLILWFAENCLWLDPDEVRDRIVKDTCAEGIDAILIDSVQRFLIFVQGKCVESFAKTKNDYPEDDIKLTLAGVKFLLRGDYKGKITPKLKNLVDEYHELDRTTDYKTKIQFVALKKPPVSDKFIEDFRADFPAIDVEFYDFDWFHHFYTNTYLSRTLPPPDMVSLQTSSKSVMVKKDPYHSKVFVCSGKDLARIYDENGEKIFQQNVRKSLGLRSRSINRQILETAMSKKHSQDFWYYNNGITIVCSEIKESGSGSVIRLVKPQIINGAQTTYALHEAYKSGNLRDDVEVLVKAITTKDKPFIENVTLYTNSQNAIRLRDLCSNDEIQRKIQKILLDSYRYFYERQRGEFQTYYPTIETKKKALGDDYRDMIMTNENAAQAFMAIYLDKPAQAKNQKGAIFSKEASGFYYQIFDDRETILAEKLLMSWKLLKFTEARRKKYEKEYKEADKKPENQKQAIYRYDFLLHSEYFILNVLKDFLKNRNLNIEKKKDDLLKVLEEIRGSSKQLEKDYQGIIGAMADFMDILKKEPAYYHNKFFKSEKSIGVLREFLTKKYKFIDVIS